MKKLFLLDAYALIYRAYYAFIKNPRYNSKGLNTSAVLGFVNTLEDVLKRENPTHIAVVFDPAGKTFRHEAFEQYKAHREATPEDIKKAIPYIKQIIEAYNIPAIEVSGFEADDVIGTMAQMAEKQDFEVYIMTPDKDYGQLVSKHIFIYRPKYGDMGYDVLGVEEVKAKFEISDVSQVIDLLGLMGDKSDNIPGCPGVGEKTAAKLLQDFGSIDNLLKNTDKLKGALKEKIEANKEQIEFSKFLATIKTDVPVELNEAQLERKPKNEEELIELYNALEFRRLAEKLTTSTQNITPPKPKAQPQQPTLFDLFDAPVVSEQSRTAETPKVEPEPVFEEKNIFSETNFNTIEKVSHEYLLLDTEEKITNFIALLSAQKTFCFDTETTGIEVFTSELVGISFCWEKGKAYYLPLPEKRENAQEILNKLKPIFENEETEKIGQNIKFDILMLAGYGIELCGKLFDTMIAHYLLQPELRHGMDYLAEVYLNYRTIHYSDLVGAKGKNQLTIRQVDIQKLCKYACEDADITFQLKIILEEELRKNNVEKLFYDIEIPLLRVLAEMEMTGVRIDTNVLKQASETLTQEMRNTEKFIYDLAGMEFNVSSAKQVGEVLFEHLKIVEKAKKTKTGQYSTSEDILEGLKSKHPIVSKILEYRGLKKLLSTYIDALPLLLNAKTGKIHTSYNQTVTATGRLSSSNPNLQNIPVRDEQGKEIRKAFIPDENCVFLSADYSQIELRIMAHLSGDENMLEAFNSGHDIHAATAAKIYKIPIKEVTSDMRRKAKTANFGIIYGISVFGLADRLDISRAEAKELIDGYFETYPQVKNYMDKSIEKAKENRFVETLLSRKRYLADINSANAMVRGYAERNAINAPIQGTAADIIKIAMVRIFDRFKKENIRSKMTMQVHDELNFSVLENELSALKKIIVEEMENAVSLKISLKVDVGTGKNWLEAH